jgi:hypothetical protein
LFLKNQNLIETVKGISPTAIELDECFDDFAAKILLMDMRCQIRLANGWNVKQ